MPATESSVEDVIDRIRSKIKFEESKIAFLENIKPQQLYHVKYVKNDSWSRVGFLGYMHTGRTPVIDYGGEIEVIFKFMATEAESIIPPRSDFTQRISHQKWVVGDIELNEWDFDSLPICLGWPKHNELLERAIKYGPEHFWKEGSQCL